MKIVTVQRSSETIPFIVTYCEKVHVEPGSGLLLIVLEGGSGITVANNDWEFYNEYEGEEVELVEVLKGLVQKLERGKK